MPENFRAIYIHPGGATATFIRQDGELDALAKGLDAEQFWVFKNVKSLLVRNDEGDLAEATRLMANVGFRGQIAELVAPRVAPSTAELREEVFAGVGNVVVEQHAGPHMPHPSSWPLYLAISVAIAFCGVLFLNTTLLVCAVGLVLTFICIVGWGLEPF